MRAATDGVSPGNAGQGCDGDERFHLLVAMEPDRRHSVKASAVREPGFAGLRPRPDDAGPAGACAMQVRETCLAARNISTPQLDDSKL